MLKRNAYFLMNIILSSALLLFVGCTRDKSKKAKNLKHISPETSQAFRASQQEDKDKEFILILDKLKEKNPFSKNHADIAKYKFRSGNLVLSGIFYDGKRPLALINDQMVGEGEAIAGKRVIKITRDEVILKDQEKEYRLRTE